tara:strand:+ start:307 stop:477 length:171 start_codon:yes stop_codon:yes gene_type:complete
VFCALRAQSGGVLDGGNGGGVGGGSGVELPPPPHDVKKIITMGKYKFLRNLCIYIL